MVNPITFQATIGKQVHIRTVILSPAFQEEGRDWQKDMGCKKGEAVQFNCNYSGGERTKQQPEQKISPATRYTSDGLPYHSY